MKENEKPYWIYLFRSQKKKIECKNRTYQLDMSKFQPKLRNVQPQLRSFLRILPNFSQFCLKFQHFLLRSAIFTLSFFPVLKNIMRDIIILRRWMLFFSFFVGAYKNTIKFEIMNCCCVLLEPIRLIFFWKI